MKSIWIEIGDHSICVSSKSDQALEYVRKGNKVISAVQTKKVDLKVDIEYGCGYPFKGFDVDIKKDNGTVFYNRGDYVINVDSGYSKAYISALNEFALKHALMNLYSVFIVHHQWGLLIHSSCLREGNQAYIFTGQSGAGKSTIVELSYPRPVLSDEATVVKITDKSTVVYDSPFRSDTISSFSQKPIELGGIQILEQAKTNHRTQLQKAESLMTLFNKVFYWANDPLETQKLFVLLRQLVTHVPVYKLQFQKNAEFWKEIS